MMKILIVSPQYLPTYGGVERYSQSLAQELARLGNRVTVATSALPGCPPSERDEAGVQVLRLPALFFLHGRFPVPVLGPAFCRQARGLWAQGFDFALIQTRFYPLCLWAAANCKKRGIEAICLEHGTKHLNLGSAAANRLGGWYEHWAMGFMRRRCPRFFGVSRAAASWLGHFGVAAEGVLYNAVNPLALSALAAKGKANWRQAFGAPAQAPMVVFLGRFIREKGLLELLEAFALVRRALPGVMLVLAGSGPLEQQLPRLKSDGVYLAGQLPYPDSLSLLAQGDVFCLPTYSEGFSTALLEAAALGTAIVTTPTGGSPELIADSEHGILLPSIAPATIAEALRKALENTGWRRRAAENARRRLEQRFTWGNTAQAFLAAAQRADSNTKRKTEL